MNDNPIVHHLVVVYFHCLMWSRFHRRCTKHTSKVSIQSDRTSKGLARIVPLSRSTKDGFGNSFALNHPENIDTVHSIFGEFVCTVSLEKTLPSGLMCRSNLLLDLGINRNSLNNVSSHLSASPVIKPGGPWVGMISQVLNVFQRYTLGKQIGDGGYSKGVRG